MDDYVFSAAARDLAQGTWGSYTAVSQGGKLGRPDAATCLWLLKTTLWEMTLADGEQPSLPRA